MKRRNRPYGKEEETFASETATAIMTAQIRRIILEEVEEERAKAEQKKVPEKEPEAEAEKEETPEENSGE